MLWNKQTILVFVLSDGSVVSWHSNGEEVVTLRRAKLTSSSSSLNPTSMESVDCNCTKWVSSSSQFLRVECKNHDTTQAVTNNSHRFQSLRWLCLPWPLRESRATCKTKILLSAPSPVMCFRVSSCYIYIYWRITSCVIESYILCSPQVIFVQYMYCTVCVFVLTEIYVFGKNF